MSENANYASSQVLTARKCAAVIGVAFGTLSRWRMAGRGPAYTKTGSGRSCRVRYRMEDVEAWLALHRTVTETPGNPYRGR